MNGLETLVKGFYRYLFIGFVLSGITGNAFANAIDGVSRIVVTHASGGNTPLQIAEIIAINESTLQDDALLTSGATAISSGTWGDVNRYGPRHTIDGNAAPGTDSSANYYHSSGQSPDSLIVVLAAPASISRLDIVGRLDCCQERDVYDIQLQNAEGTTLHQLTAVRPIGNTRRATIEFGPQPGPSQLGSWGPVKQWPLVAVSMANLPDGRLLTYSGSERRTWPSTEQTYSVIWDPVTDSFTERLHTGHNMFCGTLTSMEDGNIFVTGGRNASNSPWTTVFDPTDDDWKPLENMASGGRWYPTTLTLGSGDIMTAMGSATNVRNPDLWSSEGGWRVLNGIDFIELRTRRSTHNWFPLLTQAPNGDVFHYWDPIETHFISTEGNGHSTHADSDHDHTEHAGGVQVMYDEGKLLISGSNDGSWNRDFAVPRDAFTVDLNSDTPKIRSIQPMIYPRKHHNFVVLPTGGVMAVGGNTTGAKFQDSGSVLEAEIWNPDTGQWALTAAMTVPRDYHSTALLLADGRVITAGGGYSSGNPNSAGTHQDAQIFSPSYLFDDNGDLAPRPVITAAVGDADHGESLLVTSGSNISEFTMTRLSAVTHSMNTDQRFFKPDFVNLGNGSYQVTMHANPNVATPGYWMLFAIDNNGVPSEAEVILINSDTNGTANANDPAEVSPIIASPERSGTTVNYNAQAVGTGLVYSWNFGDGTGDTPFNTSSAVNHTYQSPGRYVVSVTVRNASGVDAVEAFTQMIHDNTATTKPKTSNSLLEIAQSNEIWITNPDNNSVAIVDTTTAARTALVPVGENPRSLALAPDGKVWVVNKDSASISVIDPDTYGVVNTLSLDTASRPHGIVFNSHSAYITLEAVGELLQLDASDGSEKNRADSGLRPRHLSIDANGTSVYVSNYITEKIPGEEGANPNVSNAGASIVHFNTTATALNKERVINLTHANKVPSENEGPGLPNYLGPMIIAPNGLTAWVPSKQDNILSGSWRGKEGMTFDQTVRATTSKVDLNNGNEFLPSRVDHDNASVASHGAFGPNGLVLFVSLEGNRQIALIDAISNLEYARFDTGFAPQSLLLSSSGTTLYVHNFLDRSLGIFDVSEATLRGRSDVDEIASVALINDEALSPEVLKGKKLFYDSRDDRLAGLDYMSCAACHNDGEHDGRSWDFTGLGEGIRNTTSLRGMGKNTGRLHWTANFDEVQDFEIQLRSFNGGEGLMDDVDFLTGTTANPFGSPKAGLSDDLDALAAYVESLDTALPSPLRAGNGELTPEAAQGRTTFTNSGCASCHSGATFTDSNSEELHKVGTIDSDSGNRNGTSLNGFDTPSLLGVWSSAPYLHDGSAATLADAIAAHAGTSLNGASLSQVAAFVAQIDSNEPAVQPPVVDPTPEVEVPDGPYSTIADIVIDGTLSDWPIEALLATDAQDATGGSNRLDFMRVWAAHDNQNVYFRYDNHAPNDVELVWGNSIGLDMDGSATGYSAGNLPIGIDYLIEGEQIHRYTGDGESWSWQWLGKVRNSLNGPSIELAVPRSLIGNPMSFNLIFSADNASIGGSAIDFVPDTATDTEAMIDTRFMSYSFGDIIDQPTPNPTPPSSIYSNLMSSVTVDGVLNDWAVVDPLGVDPNDVTPDIGTLDFLTIWAGHDANNFYFAWENDGPSEVTWGNAILMDTDLNSGTGFRGFLNDSPIGIDHLAEGDSVFQYTGNGNDWSWRYLGSSNVATSGNNIEVQIPASMIGNPPSLELFFRSDSSSIGGIGIDVFPDLADQIAAPITERRIRYTRDSSQRSLTRKSASNMVDE